MAKASIREGGAVPVTWVAPVSLDMWRCTECAANKYDDAASVSYTWLSSDSILRLPLGTPWPHADALM